MNTTTNLSTTPLTIEIPNLETIDIELQDAETVEDNAVIIYTPPPVAASKLDDFKQILQSLQHALRWSQLKRQLTKQHLLHLLRTQGKKIALTTCVLTICMAWAIRSSNIPSPNEQYLATTASLVPALSTNNTSSVSADNIVYNQSIAVSDAAQDNYIARFADLAQSEMQKYNIPASILLALAIANSHYGTHPLAQSHHNHFGISCADNPLAAGITGQQSVNGTCYSQYENAWTSFRAASVLLTSGELTVIQDIAKLDYQVWLTGLQKTQFPKADQLANLIQLHHLQEFDVIDNYQKD